MMLPATETNAETLGRLQRFHGLDLTDRTPRKPMTPMLRALLLDATGLVLHEDALELLRGEHGYPYLNTLLTRGELTLEDA